MHYFDRLKIVIALSGMMFIVFAHEGISSWGYIAKAFIRDDVDNFH